MILYVNGDSHAAAAEAVNPCAFAEDDCNHRLLGRAPHPENLAVSWAKRLSQALKSSLHCDAESASSNQRILRTTRNWIQQHKSWSNEILMIIQWSTWEREEWLIDGVYYQINASGQDDVPQSHRERYRDWVRSVDWPQVTQQAHTDISQFHRELKDLGIRHIFFNGNNHFGRIAKTQRLDWQRNYIAPYDPDATFDQWLRHNRFDTVSPKSWHFGAEAHAAWHRFMLQYIVANKFMES